MSPHHTTVSKRDLIWLPLLSLATVLVLLLGCEVTARSLLTSSYRDACEVSDRNIMFTFRANCTSHIKTSEGPWVTYSYNDCGYRTSASCKPAPPGTTRVALIGSSASKGEYVEYEQTFAARSAAELTSRCHRPVEVQNLGRRACSPACTFHRIDEALALHPDVLVMSITPHDLELMPHEQVTDRYKPMPARLADMEMLEKKPGVVKRVQKVLTESSSVVAAEHILFEDPATYVKMYLVHGDVADFLRPPFTADWRQRFSDFDLLLGEMAQKAQAAGVPFYLVEIPSLAQVSILSLKTPPPNVDATAINRELAAIAGRHGVGFVDVLDEFHRTPGSNRFFYMVDGHLDGDGEALISKPLVEKLIYSDSPSIAGCGAPLQTASLGRHEGRD